jgi:pimeloyl-ACP methyl ester carboxylesterase
MRELLLDMTVPRTFLHPEDSPVEDAEQLVAAGVRVIAVPECGHNIMLDNPEAFVAEVVAAGRAG